MGNIVALIATVLLAVGAIVYIIVSKKRGKTCIGCPKGHCASDKQACDTCSYSYACRSEDTE